MKNFDVVGFGALNVDRLGEVDQVSTDGESAVKKELTDLDMSGVEFQVSVRQEAGEEAGEPEKQSGHSDDGHAPENGKVVKFLEIRPSIALRLLTEIQEVTYVRCEVL